MLLFVDDEVATHKYITKIRGGIPVVAFSSARDAISFLDENASELTCVISDFYMVGMSGLELLTYCKTHYPHIYRILFTAMDIPDFEHALEDGTVQTLMAKPLDLAEFKRLVSDCVCQKQQRRNLIASA